MFRGMKNYKNYISLFLPILFFFHNGGDPRGVQEIAQSSAN